MTTITFAYLDATMRIVRDRNTAAAHEFADPGLTVEPDTAPLDMPEDVQLPGGAPGEKSVPDDRRRHRN